MWTCPKCEKKFRTENQWHSCDIRSVNEHLQGKPATITETYFKLEKILKDFGKVEVSPVKTSIQFRAGSNFASLRVTGQYIQVEFQLPVALEEFPIHETLRISRNRVLHRLMVEEPPEVNDRIKEWLKQSYDLISGKH